MLSPFFNDPKHGTGLPTLPSSCPPLPQDLSPDLTQTAENPSAMRNYDSLPQYAQHNTQLLALMHTFAHLCCPSSQFGETLRELFAIPYCLHPLEKGRAFQKPCRLPACRHDQVTYEQPPVPGQILGALFIFRCGENCPLTPTLFLALQPVPHP